ncbi:hypothetical protein BDB01DRAFT_871823 [Pilobolus umbonatus]|nr:hypothetical protein BDB01DRAFT_871823 [Pilobolus umbonatus]
MRTLYEQYSLAWLELSTIALFTILNSLIYLLSSISHNMDQARFKLENACQAIHVASEKLNAMPSVLINTSLQSIETAKENILRSLLTSLTVIEKCVIWIIHIYKSTYRCLLVLAINSVLSLITQITSPLEKAAEGIASLIGSNNPGEIGWTGSMEALQTNINRWFNASETLVNEVVGTPFTLLRTQINTTLSEWKIPEAPVISLMSTIETGNTCDATDLQNALTDMENNLTFLIKVAIGVLCGLILMITVCNLFYIRHKHNYLEEANNAIIESHQSGGCIEKDQLIHDLSYPKYFWRRSNKPFYRFLTFMSHPVSLYCLLVGLGGVVIIRCLLWALEKKSIELAAEFSLKAKEWTSEVSAFWMENALNEFNQINQWIRRVEIDINEQAFRAIRSGASTLNGILESVVDDIKDLVKTVLGKTILEEPANQLFECLLYAKIENLETGLQWIANHLFIRLSAIHMDMVNNTITDSLNNQMVDSASSSLEVVDISIASSLNGLLYFYYMLLVLWGISLLIGIGFQIRYRVKK